MKNPQSLKRINVVDKFIAKNITGLCATGGYCIDPPKRVFEAPNVIATDFVWMPTRKEIALLTIFFADEGWHA